MSLVSLSKCKLKNALDSNSTAESFYTEIGYCVEKRNVDPNYGENILIKKQTNR